MKDIGQIHHEMVILKEAFQIFKYGGLEEIPHAVTATAEVLGGQVGRLCDDLEIWIADNEK